MKHINVFTSGNNVMYVYIYIRNIKNYIYYTPLKLYINYYDIIQPNPVITKLADAGLVYSFKCSVVPITSPI
jgi:hypothetical protein